MTNIVIVVVVIVVVSLLIISGIIKLQYPEIKRTAICFHVIVFVVHVQWKLDGTMQCAHICHSALIQTFHDKSRAYSGL